MSGVGDQYYWDLVYPELARLFMLVWGDPVTGLSRRKSVATLFAMRDLRRTQAVDASFKAGLYLESHAVVRAAYEDWLTLAYLLRESGDTRCEAFVESVRKLDARVHDAFQALCGPTSVKKYFGDMPPDVAKYIGLPRSETQALSFAHMADDCGLRPVHDFVYAYLSGISHPDARTNQILDESEPVPVVKIPTRDASEETRLAIWFTWFAARVEILAAREFGIDHECFVEEHMLPLREESDLNLETCVLVREH